MTEENNEATSVNDPQNHQVFWNNFVKMMSEKDMRITLVWDVTNKRFVKVINKAMIESENKS